jgi:hypothetical protein
MEQAKIKCGDLFGSKEILAVFKKENLQRFPKQTWSEPRVYLLRYLHPTNMTRYSIPCQNVRDFKSLSLYDHIEPNHDCSKQTDICTNCCEDWALMDRNGFRLKDPLRNLTEGEYLFIYKFRKGRKWHFSHAITKPDKYCIECDIHKSKFEQHDVQDDHHTFCSQKCRDLCYEKMVLKDKNRIHYIYTPRVSTWKPSPFEPRVPDLRLDATPLLESDLANRQWMSSFTAGNNHPNDRSIFVKSTFENLPFRTVVEYLVIESYSHAMAKESIVSVLKNHPGFEDLEEIKLSFSDLTILKTDSFPNCPNDTIFYLNHYKKGGVWYQGLYPETLEEHRCFFCFDHTEMKCSACRMVRYCGSECQNNAWKNHKETCRAYQRISDEMKKDSQKESGESQEESDEESEEEVQKEIINLQKASKRCCPGKSPKNEIDIFG